MSFNRNYNSKQSAFLSSVDYCSKLLNLRTDMELGLQEALITAHRSEAREAWTAPGTWVGTVFVAEPFPCVVCANSS